MPEPVKTVVDLPMSQDDEYASLFDRWINGDLTNEEYAWALAVAGFDEQGYDVRKCVARAEEGNVRVSEPLVGTKVVGGEGAVAPGASGFNAVKWTKDVLRKLQNFH